MMRPKITLFVDVVSPFAYIAYYVLRNDPVFKGCDITYVPILIGGLFKLCGNAAPLTIKNKGEWVAKERVRWSRDFSVPMKNGMPPNFPVNTLTAMRMLSAVHEADRSTSGSEAFPLLPTLLDTLFPLLWVKHAEIHDPATLVSAIAPLLPEGESQARSLVESASSSSAKALLLENTSTSFEKGAFGLPWFTCVNPHTGAEESFWGVDHISQIIRFLELESPAKWKAAL